MKELRFLISLLLLPSPSPVAFAAEDPCPASLEALSQEVAKVLARRIFDLAHLQLNQIQTSSARSHSRLMEKR